MLKELGISAGTGVFLLLILYFVVKWAVRSAISDSREKIAKAVKKGIEKYEAEKNGVVFEENEEFEE